ncbi:rhomboid domain-containing protein 2 [Eucyclogobius newberryi]|uniref:rhomboid domain-containing protein 2 n=1 Tax=Eucyclogobius newberryi TaxID=166745 RepID=UPI003B59D08F
MIVQMWNDVCPKLTSGILTVVLASSLLFGVQECCNIGLTQGIFSVGASVFENGHVHRLFLYPFHHKTGAQLLLSIIAFVFLSGSLERGFGTVRFLIMFFLLSTTLGLAYAILDLLQGFTHHTEGLLPTALSCMALTTMHTKMTKGFLCGVTFPTIALPWVFLIISTILIPNAVLPCNIIAILTGWMYGKGWFSLVQMSESRASVLEKNVPFRFLRAACHTTFVPASTEERRKILLAQVCSAPPAGSYPVQAYAPASSLQHSVPMPYDGWLNYNNTLASAPESRHPLGQSHGHSHAPPPGHHIDNHSHSCNHSHNLSNMSTAPEMDKYLNILP